MLPLIIGGLVLLFGAGAGAIAINEILKEKRFAVLGERQVGKTVLLNFLRSGVIDSEEYVRTTEQKVKQGKIMLGDFELKLSSATDIGGSEEMRMRWEKLINNAEYICYIIRGDKIYNQDYIYTEKVKDHVRSIKNIVDKGNADKKEKKKKRIFLIVSYSDLIPDYTRDSYRKGNLLRNYDFSVGPADRVRYIPTFIDRERAEQCKTAIEELYREHRETGVLCASFYLPWYKKYRNLQELNHFFCRCASLPTSRFKMSPLYLQFCRCCRK